MYGKKFPHLHIVEGFGGDHHAGDEQPVHVEGSDEQIWLTVYEAIEEDVADDEA